MKAGNRARDRMIQVEIGRILANPEPAIREIRRRAARHHVLARVLVAADAREALLVAVVHDGNATQREQHRVGQQHTLQHFVIARLRARCTHVVRKASGVMIADERRQLQRRPFATFVQSVVGEQSSELVGPCIAGDGRTHGAGEREVEHCGQPGVARVASEQSHVDVRSRNFAENMKVRNALRAARCSIAGTNACQNSAFTCRAVSMRKPSTP